MGIETWLFILLLGDDIPKGSIITSIGHMIGVFIPFNIFIPLNSLKWLNKHIFKKNPLKVFFL